MKTSEAVQFFVSEAAARNAKATCEIRCVKGVTSGALGAEMEQKEMEQKHVRALVCGTLADAEQLFTDKDAANAQYVSGETALMLACQNVVSDEGDDRSWCVRLLLERGADPLVCCESGRNCLHDLLWSSRPAYDDDADEIPQVLESMANVMEILLELSGGCAVVSMLMAKDRLGFTPVHYIDTSLQENWRLILEQVLSWEDVMHPPSSSDGSQSDEGNQVPSSEARSNHPSSHKQEKHPEQKQESLPALKKRRLLREESPEAACPSSSSDGDEEKVPSGGAATIHSEAGDITQHQHAY